MYGLLALASPKLGPLRWSISPFALAFLAAHYLRARHDYHVPVVAAAMVVR